MEATAATTAMGTAAAATATAMGTATTPTMASALSKRRFGRTSHCHDCKEWKQDLAEGGFLHIFILHPTTTGSREGILEGSSKALPHLTPLDSRRNY
jgi:hypothetical protein